MQPPLSVLVVFLAEAISPSHLDFIARGNTLATGSQVMCLADAVTVHVCVAIDTFLETLCALLRAVFVARVVGMNLPGDTLRETLQTCTCPLFFASALATASPDLHEAVGLDSCDTL